MLRKPYNLVCWQGHRSYSPNPDAWIGHACGHGGACAAPLEKVKR